MMLTTGKYEYMIREFYTDSATVEQAINKIATEGWRLIAVREYWHYFERPIRFNESEGEK